MAKLTAGARKNIPQSQFGLPHRVGASKSGGEAGRGGYPMPDKSHARNAKARASQQYAKGNLSASEKATIDRKADRLLGKGK